MSKPLTRYLAYDRCLQNRSFRYSWQDLQKAANDDLEMAGYQPIGKTQFFEDVKMLKAPPYLAPIETYREGGQSYYRYTDPGYSLRKQKLTEAEAEQLRSALLILRRFSGMPQFEWVEEMIPKIEQTFNLGEQTSEVIGFEQNVDLKGLNYFGELFVAILRKKPLKISYKSFKSEEAIELVIHPYYLKQYNNRWFLLGRNPEYAGVTTLALDRIEGAILPVSQVFVENSETDFDEYFEDIIGVTRPAGKQVEEVRLWFSPAQAPYIHTKPLHGTQKEKWDETGLVVTIKVIPNPELEHLILRHGENCRALEPEDLKLRIRERLRKSLANYST